MKGLFSQYDYFEGKDYSDVWGSAIFVFDTNVLLNLYRYQARTREELLDALRKLNDRVWIPHHVALEFQRNRLKVIAAQGKKFSEVRKLVEGSRADLSNGIAGLQLNKRHSHINPEPLVKGFERLVSEFLLDLENLQKSQQSLTGLDPIKAMIEDIFDSKVGKAFLNQDEIDKINKEAEHRYKLKIPPGYKDDGKDKDEPDEYVHNGLIYKKKYGDYLVWTQLLNHASESKVKNLIFITDDAKEDWWSQIDFEGPKTVGPRPELVDEATRLGKIETFLMYKPEGFLKYASEFLSANVSKETLTEVHDVSIANKNKAIGKIGQRITSTKVTEVVWRWVQEAHPNIYLQSIYPDLICHEPNGRHGYEVVRIKSEPMHHIEFHVKEAEIAIEEQGLESLCLVIVVEDATKCDDVLFSMTETSRREPVPNLRFCIGYIDWKNNEEVFFPIYFISHEDICV
ncbi:PIN-like domain-containing protein [Pseudomonas syringae]|uniref:PIN-like domain-containing protein n=1 Tax=Pseudomonas syringae TaxID=317 RepID=UPI00200A57C2|nr:PIN domain-containing protein [Pseudomonas syringae]MCK9691865.1 PIN-like domain-containing protein [Pseudomonas syringae pv. syringae]